MLEGYRRTLNIALRHPRSMMMILLAVLGLNFYLYDIIPKGFFPQQDTGRLVGIIQADQSISFQLMQQKLTQFVSIIKKDPAVETAVGFTGGGQTNSGFMFVSLLPLNERKLSADQSSAACGENSPSCQERRCICRRFKTFAPAAAPAMRSISIRCRAPPSTSSTNGLKDSRGPAERTDTHRRQ